MQLKDYLTPENIQIGCQANDWRHAIEIAAQPLLRDQAIDPSYVTAMQQAVNDFGPYMVLAEGFALAHAKPGEGVHKVCMSLITIDPAVVFGNPQFDPVDILVAFGTPDADSHIGILRELGALLLKPETFGLIRSAKTPVEVFTLFSQHPDEHTMPGGEN